MEIKITGDPKEIAALVVAIQERQKPSFVPETSNGRSVSLGNIETGSMVPVRGGSN